MRSKRAIKAALATLSVGLTLGLAACGNDDSGDAGGMEGMDHSSSAPMSPAPSAGGSASTSAEFNDADVMFVQGMMPHHQQAVKMSDTLLSKDGVSAETTTLAQQIKAAQQPEIDTMTGWLTDWGESADGGMDEMDHDMGGGMATDDELKQFDEAQGLEAERMYLKMMTKHHQGAIAVAKTEISDGKNPDAVTLASYIVSSQHAEIDTMKQILAKL